MPLPSLLHGAKQCTAKSKRTGLACRNPAAYGCKTCRVHGARKKETIKRGKLHPNYMHGDRTIENIESYKQAVKELRELSVVSKILGMVR